MERLCNPRQLLECSTHINASDDGQQPRVHQAKASDPQPRHAGQSIFIPTYLADTDSSLNRLRYEPPYIPQAQRTIKQMR